MLRFSLLLGVLWWGSFMPALGQSGKWIKKGEAAYAAESYAEAIEYFEWAKKKNGGSKAMEGLGKCWWALRDYQQAETYFRLAAEDPASSPINYFFLGRCLVANQKYQAASDAFARCRSSLREDEGDEFASLSRMIPTLLGDSAGYEISLLPFNSAASDFSPAFFEGGIAFSSARVTQNSVVLVSNGDGNPMTDLWLATQDGEGNWAQPRPLSSLNSKVNEGPLSLDSTRGKLYFTRNDPEQRRKRASDGRLNRLRIYEAVHDENGWTPGSVLPFSTAEHPVGHPALSGDGTRMVFAAEFPDGFGGADLYLSIRTGNDWSSPVNLGPGINSSGDDLFPFLSEDGTLCFASDGRLGLGGLDIFFARANGSGWFSPVNAGFPLNTQADDFGYITRDEGRSGYFSSNRKGSIADDNIYAFRQLRPSFECSPQEDNIYCYHLVDEGSQGMIDDTAPLVMEWNLGDGTRIVADSVDHCYEGPGDYTVELNLVDTVTGFIFLNQATYGIEVRDIEQVYIDGPDTVIAGKTAEFNALRSVVPDCEVRKYHWEFADGARMTGEMVQYAFPEPGIFKVRLGTEGDSMGTSRRCLDCVYREVVVMEEERFQQVQDSVEKARELEQIRLENDPHHQDSIRKAQTLDKSVRHIRDSLNRVYRLQLLESQEPIDPKSIEFEGGEVSIHDLGDRFSYTTGEEKDPENLLPTFRSAHEQGYDEAIVVAFRDEHAPPGSRSETMLKLPAKVNTKGVSIFRGEIVDSKGQPLPAEINLEDLSKGILLVQSKADEKGKFRIELPNGELYGYFIDLPNYYPVSDVIDLREVEGANGQPEIVFNKEITLMTVREIFEQGLAVRINNVFFDFDSDVLRNESRLELDRLARILIENPDLDVEIMGHTDDVGGDDYNLDLSRRRARSVMRYLVLSGYPTEKISFKGFGEQRPLMPNDSPESRQMNRRVEFRFLPAKP